jgi:DNA ligase-1
MTDIADGESVEVQGSGKKPYVLKNTGGVYSCSCPAWRNQSLPIEKRTCKHLRGVRGEQVEKDRVGSVASGSAGATKKSKKSKSSAKTSSGPPILLAHRWENDVPLTDWWMSEKLDGVRAYWDGSQFLSRQGNTFHAPDWFIEHLPKTPLDGGVPRFPSYVRQASTP